MDRATADGAQHTTFLCFVQNLIHRLCYFCVVEAMDEVLNITDVLITIGATHSLGDARLDQIDGSCHDRWCSTRHLSVLCSEISFIASATFV